VLTNGVFDPQYFGPLLDIAGSSLLVQNAIASKWDYVGVQLLQSLACCADCECRRPTVFRTAAQSRLIFIACSRMQSYLHRNAIDYVGLQLLQSLARCADCSRFYPTVLRTAAQSRLIFIACSECNRVCIEMRLITWVFNFFSP
jgi:hypothetical protein